MEYWVMMWCSLFANVHSTQPPMCLEQRYGPMSTSSMTAGAGIFPYLSDQQKESVTAVRLEFFKVVRSSDTTLKNPWTIEADTMPLKSATIQMFLPAMPATK